MPENKNILPRSHPLVKDLRDKSKTDLVNMILELVIKVKNLEELKDVETMKRLITERDAAREGFITLEKHLKAVGVIFGSIKEFIFDPLPNMIYPDKFEITEEYKLLISSLKAKGYK